MAATERSTSSSVVHRVADERAASAGVTGPVAALYPSLHLTWARTTASSAIRPPPGTMSIWGARPRRRCPMAATAP